MVFASRHERGREHGCVFVCLACGTGPLRICRRFRRRFRLRRRRRGLGLSGRTVIELLPRAPGRLRAGVHDVSGRRIRSLFDDTVAAGPVRISWDGRDDRGRVVAAGVYFVRVSGSAGGAGNASARFVLIRYSDGVDFPMVGKGAGDPDPLRGVSGLSFT